MECRSNPQGGAGTPADFGGGFKIERARLGVLDEAVPTILQPAGAPLRNGEIVDGPQGFQIRATHVGGGIAKLVLIVDGGEAAEQFLSDTSPSCRPPYVDFVPCPLDVGGAVAFDTTKVSDGPHRVQVGAVDAAGNAALTPPADVYFANGGVPNGVGATRQARIRASLGGSHALDKVVGFRRREVLHGRLTDTGGHPIRRARVEIRSTSRRRDDRPRLEGRVTTGPGGRFAFKLRLGPSRRILAEYFATSSDPAPSARAAVTLRVRAGVRLTVRPRRTASHGTIRFLGKLLGGPGRAKAQVGLYAVDRTGRRRVPVELLSTGKNGRFRFQYRFVRTFAPFTYRFQARVAAQPGYPYAAGQSRVVTVRIVR